MLRWVALTILAALVFGGIVGAGVAVWMVRGLRRDVEALKRRGAELAGLRERVPRRDVALDRRG